MRRLLPVLVVAALAAGACSSDGEPDAGPGTSVDGRALPEQLVAFLDQVAPQGETAFRATYRVVRKVGGLETEVRVEQSPPRWTITAGDLRLTGPPAPEASDEAALSAFGVFANFYASGPASALTVDARRSTASAPVFSDRTIAGVTLECAAVPQAGVVTQTACLTPEGVFGFVDNASVRVELTAYEVTTAR
ncbi:MAG TPA: hypothetical protein VIH00_05120 [Candidatus Limnocylindrales bacterium]